MEPANPDDRALVERFKREYERRRKAFTIGGFSILGAGIALAITGAVLIGVGDSYFGVDSDLWWDLSTGGTVTLMAGVFSTFIGICLSVYAKQNTMVQFIQQKMHLHRLDDPDVLLKQVRDTRPPEAGVAKVVIRDVVKVRCSYCKSLVDIAEGKCPTCGASL